MAEELKKLQKAASDVETQLSVVMKFRWAMADQSKADQLVEDLSMYNQSLERYLTPLGRLSVAKKGAYKFETTIGILN